jgi:hypothetical protein
MPGAAAIHSRVISGEIQYSAARRSRFSSLGTCSRACR